MLPNIKAIEIPLLEALIELGGQAQPKEIYPLVAKKFPEIKKNDLLGKYELSGLNRWKNRVQWARQVLVHQAEMDSPKYGVWRITEKGEQRLKKQKSGSASLT